ncbi:MAG: FKBP-type peptidyl-prolyl cis-trans isomerase [Tannerella sp.]|nr:FKBP-type peptidyl-prolyl cis-trans isomerase [Tannerella sp.]
MDLKTTIDSISYLFGSSIGTEWKQRMTTLPGGNGNIEALKAGFINAIKGDTSLLGMTPEQANELVNGHFTRVQMEEAESENARGEAFLAQNKTKEGVITTESGLQYKVIKEGDGPKPTVEDQVKVHYTGKFIDGTVFESSVQRGEPVTFGVTQVIRGWTEGLQIMPAGSKYIFWIPSDLAYGQQGNQGIKPNTTLEFEIELLEVIKN